jgi:hypothetical protein
MIKRRADYRSEDQAVIFAKSAGQQPVLRLAVDMLTERCIANRGSESLPTTKSASTWEIW